MIRNFSHVLGLFVSTLLLITSAKADVRLPAVLSSNLVLQQKSTVRLWGWAYEGETVLVETSWGEHAKATADKRGQWQVLIKTPAARPLNEGLRPEHITFTVPKENAVQIQNLLIGEVWLCSGQSNMCMMLGPDYPKGNNDWYGDTFWTQAGPPAPRPGLRVFNVEKTTRAEPQDDCKGVLPDHVILPKNPDGLMPEPRAGWQSYTPETAPYISAVAYYFGAALQEKLNVPVGLVVSAVGGSQIEAWISLPSLRTVAGHADATSKVHRMGTAALFNGMIAPLAPFTFRGVIWYQGESNSDTTARATAYGPLLETLVRDWRQAFDQPDLPFKIVQLAGWGKPSATPADSNPALVREAQAEVARRIPGCQLAVAIDLGANTIHPPNKRDVGLRLAAQALDKTYGVPTVSSGPVFERLETEGRALRLHFTHTEGGLVARDGALKHFALAGADGQFVWAQAVIDGDTVLVSSPEVPAPTQVRYAWATQPAGCNLYNGAGLPAAPFRAQSR
ncbi:MAG: sialate O-acetylesterase [Verrucomicrobia bacterium]|nr:sialate O-acetylesterase [Verrucomicrobiota bacterium]